RHRARPAADGPWPGRHARRPQGDVQPALRPRAAAVSVGQHDPRDERVRDEHRPAERVDDPRAESLDDPAAAASDRSAAAEHSAIDESDDQPLPTFSEQLAEQLGGVRGVLESSIPIIVFIIVNFWSLKPAMIIAVASAVVIAIVRLLRRQTVRHAINGVFGVAIGAAFAWKTGSAKDFYLPGIILSFCYGIAMIASVVVRRPLVGWIWSLLIAGGSTRWREQPPMVRLFSRLTILWAITYLVKVAIQTWLFHNTPANDPGTALGIARLPLRHPPYPLVPALTARSGRRLTPPHP